MTRQEYIAAVKVKIDEISPFDEPSSFIAADGDADYANVKPIVEYIDKSLDEATRNCLRALPLSLLHADVVSESKDIVVTADGVGSFAIPANIRPILFRSEELLRDITAFITSEDPLYLLQQNRYTRGGIAKPMAVVSSGEVYNVGGFPQSTMGQLEIYSLRATGSRRTIPATEVRSGMTTPTNRFLYIKIDKKPGELSDYLIPDSSPAAYTAEVVQSPIEDLIVLECAAIVSDILGNPNVAAACRNEQQTKIQAILK